MFVLWEFGRHVLSDAPSPSENASWLSNMLATSRVGVFLRDTLLTESTELPLDKFLTLYGVSAMASTLMSIIVAGPAGVSTLGASGAVMGVLTKHWLMFPTRPVTLYGLIDMNGSEILYTVTLVNLLGGVFQGFSDVDYVSHLGGQVGCVLLQTIEQKRRENGTA